MARQTREFFEHPLTYVRADRDWTYQDLVNVIARPVDNMSTRREKAWRWEHWGVVPDQASQLALATELGVPAAERGGDRATYLMWRAETILELGDIDHACELVGEAVPSIAAARSARNQRRLANLHQRLIADNYSPAVTRLNEQLRSLDVA